MKRLRADARINTDGDFVQNFRWEVCRFRRGQARRLLRDAVFDAGVDVNLDPPSPAESAKIEDDVTLLRSTFAADRGEPMEERGWRSCTRTSSCAAYSDAIDQAAMIVCRPGPGWSVEEACAVLRRGNAS